MLFESALYVCIVYKCHFFPQISFVILPRMAVSITYYGVTFNAGNMGGNFYLNLFLMGFVEIPGLTLGMYTMQRFGRRKANAGTMVMAGVACLSTIPTAVIGSQSRPR